MSVLNGTSTLNLGSGTITYSNSYLSLTESADNTNVIIDIDSKYLNTTTSLSTLYYPQSTINSMLTSYQPKISTNSTLNLATVTLGNSTGTGILNIKGTTATTIPTLFLQSGSNTSPPASQFYVNTYSDVNKFISLPPIHL